MTGRADPSSRHTARRSGLRRWSGLAVLGVVLLAAICAAVVASSALSLKSATARSDIEAELSRLTGLPVFVGGAASFTLLPRTQISLADTRVGSRAGEADAVMTIDVIVADLDLWEALWGRTRIERLTLVRPELLSTNGFIRDTGTPGVGTVATTPDSALQPLSRYVSAFLSRFGALRSVDIRDGVFRMAPGPGSLGISNANLTVAWPSPTSSARLTGSYVWNGEPTEIGLKIAAPVNFLDGAASAVDFTLASPPLTVSFDGEATLGGAGRFAGSLSVATSSLTHSIRWLGDAGTVLPDIGPLSIKAQLDASGRKLNLRQAAVSINGFTGLGALEMLIPEDKRPSIGGTLAFDQLDLTDLAEAVAPLPRTPLDMQRRIPVDFVDGLDLDLRLSAAEGMIVALPFNDLAATVKFKDGVATLDLGDIAILGGQAQARLSVDSKLRPAQLIGAASVEGVDAASLMSAAGVSALTLSGTSDIHADFSMPVSTWADLTRRSKIALSVTARNGALGGFDPQIFAVDAAKPLALAARDNALPFQSLRAKLKSTGPLVDIDSVVMAGSYGTLSATGSLSAATRSLDLFGSIEPMPAATPTVGPDAATPSRFRMLGLWPTPSISASLPTRPM